VTRSACTRRSSTRAGHAWSGRGAPARRRALARAAAHLATQVGRDSAELLYGRAAIAASLGERDAAVALLRAALARGASMLGAWLHRDPELAPLFGRRDFEELTRPQG
jgi:hypothetical protein